MKPRFLTIVFLALCVCTLTIGVAAQKGHTTTIPLRITIESTGPNGAPCKICSDGRGEYIDGVDGVTASIRTSYALTVNFQDSLTSTPLRSVNFDYSDPVPPNTTLIPPLTELVIQRIVTGFPQTDWLAMGFGDSQCLQLDWRFTNPNVQVRSDAFQYGPVPAGSSYSVITCTAVDGAGNCSQWEIEPRADGACNAAGSESIAVVSKITNIRNKYIYTPYGLYRMPFKLTLRKK